MITFRVLAMFSVKPKGKKFFIISLIALLLLFILIHVWEFFANGFVADGNATGIIPWIKITLAFLITGVLILFIYSIPGHPETQKNDGLSEFRFKTLFENSSDEIYVIDFEENFLLVNKAMCDALGYSQDELLKMNVRDIKPDKYGDIVESLLDKLKKEGSLVFESEHISRDGKKIPVEIKSRIIDYGNAKAILSIARDISERRQLERKILSAILETEEKERERFAKDLHDGLGPLLSSIEIYINILLSGKVEKNEQQNLLDYIKALTSEAHQNVREISNNLRPSVISRFGLIAAINSLCEKLNKSGVVNVSLVTENFADQGLNKEVEVALYRIVNELLNNTLKHAFAKNISIRFSKENGTLLLKYTDDGVGFDFHETIKSSTHKGMGLSNILSRVNAINGICRFNSSPESGTEVLIKVKTN